MRTHELLLEHNIINLPDLENWVNELASRCTTAQGVDWVRSKFRKYLINADETSDRVAGLSPNAPDWMTQRFEDGVALHRFRANTAVRDKLLHIVDWVNSLNSYATTPHDNPTDDLLAKEAAMTLPKLDKYSVEQAEAATEKWFGRLNKASSLVKHDGRGTVIVLKTSVGNWIELLDKEATKYEGAQMGHCVGGGSYTVGENGAYRIFSLRDSKNDPHVTVSINQRSNQLDQVKGKGNEAPVAKYQQAVIDLLNLAKPTVSGMNHDLDRMGVFYNDGKFGGIQDVGEKVADIDSVSVFKMVERGSYGNTPTVKYYFWRKHVYGVCKVGECTSYSGTRHGANPTKYTGLTAIDYMGTPSPGVKSAVWKIMAQFLNSLDPIPKPSSGLECVYSTKLERYGLTRQEISEEVGFLSDGTTVMQYDGTLKQIDLYDESGQHNLTLLQDEKKINSYGSDPTIKYQIRALPVHGVEPPAPEQIMEAIKLSGLKGGSSRLLRDLGVWPTEFNATFRRDPDNWSDMSEPFVPFDPEKLGMSPLNNGFWGGEKTYHSDAPDEGSIYDSKGRDCADVQFANSKPNGIVPSLIIRVRNPKGITQHNYQIEVDGALTDPAKLAAWFSRVKFAAPTRPYQRDQMKRYNLVIKKGEWVSMANAAKASSQGEFTIQALRKDIIVSNTLEEIVVKAKKGYNKAVDIEKLAGAKVVDRQKAMLALDAYLVKSGEHVQFDPTEFARAMVGIDPETKRLKPVREVFPDRLIKQYEGKGKWVESFLENIDGSFPRNMHSWPRAGKYTLYAEDGIAAARVYAETDKDISKVVVAIDGKMTSADSDNIIGIIPYLNDLIDEESLRINRNYFSNTLKLTSMGGKVKPLADDARMEEFVRGQITYEDGKRWKKPIYSKDYNWELVADEQTSSGRTSEVTILRVKIGQNGLENAQFNRKDAQRGAKAYMGYIMDLVELAVGD